MREHEDRVVFDVLCPKAQRLKRLIRGLHKSSRRRSASCGCCGGTVGCWCSSGSRCGHSIRRHERLVRLTPRVHELLDEVRVSGQLIIDDDRVEVGPPLLLDVDLAPRARRSLRRDLYRRAFYHAT